MPQHSGFIASLVSGDYVFVAGQMPNNEEMTGIAKPAYRPPNAVWNGTDIRLQTEFLITSRLKPALEAGGSSLRNAIKAQVYLTNIQDLPEFLDVWNGHFGEHPCALTVVATKGLALAGVDHGDQHLRRARQCQDQESRSSITSRRSTCGSVPRRCAPAICYACRRSMPPTRTARSIGARHCRLEAFRRAAHGTRCGRSSRPPTSICRAAGASLANLMRVNHFVGDLDASSIPALRAWQEQLSGAPIPFGAVRTPSPMPVPGCNIVADMWVYHP